MAHGLRASPLQRAARLLITAGTFAGLAAFGWYGHHTHWTFGLAGAGRGPHAEHGGSHDRPHAVGAAPDEGQHAAAPGPAGVSAPGPAGASPARPPAYGPLTFDDVATLERAGIESVPVRTEPIAELISANGVVRYDERRIAQLSVRAPGIVWRVDKRLGDPVSKGDVLVVIDSAEVGRLKAEFLTALVVFESRREALAILEEVRGAVMGRQLREANSALREARNSLLNAEQALVNLGFEISIDELAPLDDEARAERMRLLGLPRDLLTGVDVGRLSSNLLPLRAPFDGMVIGRDVVVGEITDPTRSIFEIVDLSTMWIVLNVAKEDASRLAIGQRVRFRPDGDDRDYESTVTWISTEVDEKTRTLQVRAEIKTGHSAASTQRLAGLRANVFGTGTIEIDVRSQACVVPVESVQSIGSDWVVFVPSGETSFEVRPVVKGLERGNMVELLGDLAGMTHVVGPGSHVLKSKLLLERVASGGL